MFRRLYFWLFKDRYDYYHPGERKLYKYFNGKEMVTEDPMVLYKKIMDVGPELDVDWKLAMSISKDARLGHNKLVEKVRKVFAIPPLKEGGLTETETVDLLFHFMIYTGMIKKNSQTVATPATAPSPSTESSPAGESATTNTSDSGSTATDTETSKQELSPSELASPSAPSTPDTTSS